MGLTLGQYTALSVFQNSGPLTNAKLAEYIMVTPQASFILNKGIEKNGWIVRKPDPNNGRIINISLTIPHSTIRWSVRPAPPLRNYPWGQGLIGGGLTEGTAQ
jgi:hypothetical protein